MSDMYIEESVYESASYLSKRKIRQLSLFWIGLLLYTIGYVVPSIIGYNASSAVIVIQLMGFLSVSVSMVGIIRSRFESGYLRFMYFIYCLWLFITILRGFHFLLDRDYFIPFLFDPYEGLLYFAPLALLFPQNFQSYRKLLNAIILFGICYAVFDVIFIRDLLNRDVESKESQNIVESLSILAYPCGFILLTFSYHAKKRRFIATVVTMMAFAFAVYRARRGLSFMYASMVMFSVILYIFRTKAKVFLIVLSIFLGLLVVFYFINTNLSNVGLFKNFAGRIDDDTRSYVSDCYYADLKTIDWAIGKGLNGKYFCPGVEENIDFRNVIETGYLTTILKGGLVSIVLFLLIALPAIINGLFLSKNILSKAAALWILMSQVNSYPGTTNGFILSYLMVWISIGICYSREIRQMSDETIINFLYPEYNLTNE